MINQTVNFRNHHLKNLFYFYRTEGFYIGERFYDYESLSTSTHNEFIPLPSFFVGKVVSPNNVTIYPKIRKGKSAYKEILRRFTDKLTNRGSLDYVRFEYKDGDVYRTLYVGYGFILDEDYNFLFLASFRGCLNQRYMEFNEQDLEDSLAFGKRDIKIFITYDFMTTYRRFYNRVKREFLDEYLESGCELSIVDSDIIEDSVYGNEFEENSNLETIEDKMSFIEEFRNTILEYEQ